MKNSFYICTIKLKQHAMKTSELINVLTLLLDKNGDNDIIVSVKDAYGIYGNDAELNIDVTGTIWSGVMTNRDTKQTRLTAFLNDDLDGKKPKVTFRK